MSTCHSINFIVLTQENINEICVYYLYRIRALMIFSFWNKVKFHHSLKELAQHHVVANHRQYIHFLGKLLQLDGRLEMKKNEVTRNKIALLYKKFYVRIKHLSWLTRQIWLFIFSFSCVSKIYSVLFFLDLWCVRANLSIIEYQ